jgi:hypothetical protein
VECELLGTGAHTAAQTLAPNRELGVDRCRSLRGASRAPSRSRELYGDLVDRLSRVWPDVLHSQSTCVKQGPGVRGVAEDEVEARAGKHLEVAVCMRGRSKWDCRGSLRAPQDSNSHSLALVRWPDPCAHGACHSLSVEPSIVLRPSRGTSASGNGEQTLGSFQQQPAVVTRCRGRDGRSNAEPIPIVPVCRGESGHSKE